MQVERPVSNQRNVGAHVECFIHGRVPLMMVVRIRAKYLDV